MQTFGLMGAAHPVFSPGAAAYALQFAHSSGVPARTPWQQRH